MKCKNLKGATGHAIIWASAIIAVSILLRGTEQASHAVFILIVCSYAALVLNRGKSSQADSKQCCRSLFNQSDDKDSDSNSDA